MGKGSWGSTLLLAVILGTGTVPAQGTGIVSSDIRWNGQKNAAVSGESVTFSADANAAAVSADRSSATVRSSTGDISILGRGRSISVEDSVLTFSSASGAFRACNEGSVISALSDDTYYTYSDAPALYVKNARVTAEAAGDTVIQSAGSGAYLFNNKNSADSLKIISHTGSNYINAGADGITAYACSYTTAHVRGVSVDMTAENGSNVISADNRGLSLASGDITLRASGDNRITAGKKGIDTKYLADLKLYAGGSNVISSDNTAIYTYDKNTISLTASLDNIIIGSTGISADNMEIRNDTASVIIRSENGRTVISGDKSAIDMWRCTVDIESSADNVLRAGSGYALRALAADWSPIRLVSRHGSNDITGNMDCETYGRSVDILAENGYNVIRGGVSSGISQLHIFARQNNYVSGAVIGWCMEIKAAEGSNDIGSIYSNGMSQVLVEASGDNRIVGSYGLTGFEWRSDRETYRRVVSHHGNNIITGTGNVAFETGRNGSILSENGWNSLSGSTMGIMSSEEGRGVVTASLDNTIAGKYAGIYGYDGSRVSVDSETGSNYISGQYGIYSLISYRSRSHGGDVFVESKKGNNFITVMSEDMTQYWMINVSNDERAGIYVRKGGTIRLSADAGDNIIDAEVGQGIRASDSSDVLLETGGGVNLISADLAGISADSSAAVVLSAPALRNEIYAAGTGVRATTRGSALLSADRGVNLVSGDTGLYALDNGSAAMSSRAGRNIVYGGTAVQASNGGTALLTVSDGGVNLISADTGLYAFNSGNVIAAADAGSVNRIAGVTGVSASSGGSALASAAGGSVNDISADTGVLAAGGGFALVSADSESHTLITGGTCLKALDTDSTALAFTDGGKIDISGGTGIYAGNSGTASLTNLGGTAVISADTALHAENSGSVEAVTQAGGCTDISSRVGVLAVSGGTAAVRGISADTRIAASETGAAARSGGTAYVTAAGGSNYISGSITAVYADDGGAVSVYSDQRSYLNGGRFGLQTGMGGRAAVSGALTVSAETAAEADGSDAEAAIRYGSDSLIQGDIRAADGGTVTVAPDDGGTITVTGNLYAGASAAVTEAAAARRRDMPALPDAGGGTVDFILSDGSTWTGAASAGTGIINVTLEGYDSVWNITGRSQVTSLGGAGYANFSNSSGAGTGLEIAALTGSSTFGVTLSKDGRRSDMIYVENGTAEVQGLNVKNLVDFDRTMNVGDSVRFATVKNSRGGFYDPRGIQSPRGVYNSVYMVSYRDADSDPDNNVQYNESFNGTEADASKPGNATVQARYMTEGAKNAYLVKVTDTRPNRGSVTPLNTAQVGWRSAAELDTFTKRTAQTRLFSNAADPHGENAGWYRISHRKFGLDNVGSVSGNYYEAGYSHAFTDEKGVKHFWGPGFSYSKQTGSWEGTAGSLKNRDAAFTLYDTEIFPLRQGEASGWFYWDKYLRVHRIKHTYSAADEGTGLLYDGKYENTSVNLSTEVGRKIPISKRWYWVPQAQLQLTWLDGYHYYDSQNLEITGEDEWSLKGRLGFDLVNIIDPENDSRFYLKASVIHEFLDGGRVSIYSSEYGDFYSERNSRIGTWFIAGAGLSAKIGDNSYVYFDCERIWGNDYRHTWEIQAGMRFEF